MNTANQSNTEYLKCHLLQIDAWRDSDNLWQWNNSFKLEDDIHIQENISNRSLIKFFRNDLKVINDYSKGRVAIEDDQYNLVLVDKNTNQPLFALCYGEYL